jgi:hypothetical protein
MWDLRIFDIFQILIFSIISFAISMYISDNFKLSNYLFIKILQKLVFINCILVLLGFIFYLLGVSIFPTLFCDGDSDNEYSNSGNTSSEESENEEGSLPPADATAAPHSSPHVGGGEAVGGGKDIARITTNRDDTPQARGGRIL